MKIVGKYLIRILFFLSLISGLLFLHFENPLLLLHLLWYHTFFTWLIFFFRIVSIDFCRRYLLWVVSTTWTFRWTVPELLSIRLSCWTTRMMMMMMMFRQRLMMMVWLRFFENTHFVLEHTWNFCRSVRWWCFDKGGGWWLQVFETTIYFIIRKKSDGGK